MWPDSCALCSACLSMISAHLPRQNVHSCSASHLTTPQPPLDPHLRYKMEGEGCSGSGEEQSEWS
jgi:hypothetical protein